MSNNKDGIINANGKHPNDWSLSSNRKGKSNTEQPHGDNNTARVARIKTMVSPLASKTLSNMFEQLAPSLVKEPDDSLILTHIAHYLFTDFTKNQDYLEQSIKERTNLMLFLTLKGVKKIIKDFEITTCTQLDRFFLSKRERSKMQVTESKALRIPIADDPYRQQ